MRLPSPRKFPIVKGRRGRAAFELLSEDALILLRRMDLSACRTLSVLPLAMGPLGDTDVGIFPSSLVPKSWLFRSGDGALTPFGDPAVRGLWELKDFALVLLLPKNPVGSSEVDNLREAFGLMIDKGSHLNGSSGFSIHDGRRGRLRLLLRLLLLSRELTDM